MEPGIDRSACAVCGERRPEAFRIWFDGKVKLYRCRSCGFVSLFCGPGGDTLATEDPAVNVLGFTERGPLKYPERRGPFEDILSRLRAEIPDGRLLDVGCGDGHFLSLCRTHYDCYGVEVTPGLSDYASLLARAPVTCARYSADVFPPESFDVVTLLQVLEHLPNPREIVAACHWHLRPGGMVVIEVPSIRAPHFLLYRATRLKGFVDNPGGVIRHHFGYYEPTTLTRLVESCGFRTKQIVTGRWSVKYRGTKRAAGLVADPLLNRLRVGGLLLFAEKLAER